MSQFDCTELQRLTKEQLIEIILERSEKVESLTRLVGELSQRIADLERAAARSAAPFSKGKGKVLKKKPGRRAGEGRFTRRMEPEVQAGDTVETIAVPLVGDTCAGCGGKLGLENTEIEVATVTDVPAQPGRVITRYEVEVATCKQCGRKGRGQHPDLPTDQQGATAHRVGPNVLAQALALHYGSGLTLCKTAEAIGMLTGISITQSALTQRAGNLCAEGGIFRRVYEDLREQIRQSPVVNTDDTGWRTGGKASYLMGFFTPSLAVYQIRERHRHEEVQEVIGEVFKGILGTDRGSSYEALDEEVMQQKCLSHLLKNLSAVREGKTGPARRFTGDLMKILRAGLELWHNQRDGKISKQTFRRRADILSKRLDHQLRPRELTDADNQRLLDGIGRQNDKGRVTLFLLIPEVEPTNNRGERELRSAVIARKVSQCSKNALGERIFETTKSITGTLRLRGHNIVQGLVSIIRGGKMPEPIGNR